MLFLCEYEIYRQPNEKTQNPADLADLTISDNRKYSTLDIVNLPSDTSNNDKRSPDVPKRLKALTDTLSCCGSSSNGEKKRIPIRSMFGTRESFEPAQ